MQYIPRRADERIRQSNMTSADNNSTPAIRSHSPKEETSADKKCQRGHYGPARTNDRDESSRPRMRKNHLETARWIRATWRGRGVQAKSKCGAFIEL